MQKDNTYKGVPNILDGTPCLPPAKTTGQNKDDQLWNEMVENYEVRLKKEYPYHLEFFTMNELIEYVDLEFYMNTHPNYSHTKFIKQERLQELEDKLNLEYIFRRTEEDFQKLKHLKLLEKKSHIKSNNRYELGAREFTFTYSPKWFDDAEARLRMSTGIQKICKYYKDEILQLRAVGEVGTNGLSHIHCFYKLRGGHKITDKNFKRAWSMWDTHIKQGLSGHKGGHHASVRNEADFQGYIDKDIENAWYEVAIDNTADPGCIA